MTSRVTDPKEFGRVAVVMGGTASEREVSLVSGKAVLDALLARGVNAVGCDIDGNPLDHLQGKGYSRVFNIVHGRGGEDGILQALLEALRIPYTGSKVLASALAMDKLLTKRCWLGSGLPTPRWMVLTEPEDLERCADTLGFPLMVKPAEEGSSIGMSRADDPGQLVEAWKKAKPYNCEVFAEQWVFGREYTAGVLQGESLPLIRLETPHVFYDFDAKYRASSTQYHCPAGLEPAQEASLRALALHACETIGVQGWGRVDLLLDNEDQPWLIEVNTVPGMTDHSLVPMAARAAGIEFDELVWRILETSFPAEIKGGR
jgi:D-alanine-D-alanine ligase